MDSITLGILWGESYNGICALVDLFVMLKYPTRNELIDKTIQKGNAYAVVCGIKEPKGRVHVLGVGPTPCWYFLTLTEKSTSARKYRCSTSPRSIQGIVFSTGNGSVTVF